MATVKLLPVHHHGADYIFLSPSFNHFENRVLLKIQEGVASVAHFITGHVKTHQTSLNFALHWVIPCFQKV